MIPRLARWFSARSKSPATSFVFEEVAALDAHGAALFERCFKSPAPDFPRHFVARKTDEPRRGICGYIHFTEFESGVYLLGGLCVDTTIYRQIGPEVRREIADHGSLSRWLLNESIEGLGAKRAVFAYTGNTMSRRDGDATGFVPAAGEYLIVQWHAEPASSRADLLRRVEAIGPF